METFKPVKGVSQLYIIFYAIVINLLIGIFIYLIDSYVIISLFRIALIVINVYLLYYLALTLSLSYSISSDSIIIKSLWGFKKVQIPFNEIIGYDVGSGTIRGVKLTGIGNDRFTFGKIVIDKVGTTHMFTTSNKTNIYIKTASVCYGISPVETEGFEQRIVQHGISKGIEGYKVVENVDLYKQKAFFLPFLVVTIVIVILTLNPFLLYLGNRLPGNMPLDFNAAFDPVQFGSGKQFAFKQMAYGVLNMVILLCMYYASYFCAKYDRKIANRYMYVSMLIAVTFLVMQIRILITFR